MEPLADPLAPPDMPPVFEYVPVPVVRSVFTTLLVPVSMPLPVLEPMPVPAAVLPAPKVESEPEPVFEPELPKFDAPIGVFLRDA
jgi:hypothetical protein